MSKPLIQQIVDQDLCIACGSCVEACPSSVVEPAYSEYRGAHEVAITDTSGCSDCDAPCERVCPSVSALPRKYAGADRVGPVQEVRTGYAADFRDDGVSSSGGVLRALLHSQVKNNGTVLALTRIETDGGAEYQPTLVDDMSGLRAIPGSIYHSVQFHGAINLLRASNTPVTLVALPCQLEGIEKYLEEFAPELQDKIALKVGVICGWMYSDHALHNYLHALGIKETWLDAQYRGEDEVGRLKIITTDRHLDHSRRKFENFGQAWAYHSSFSRDANRQRCRLCQNHISVTADVAIGDAWLQRLRGQKTSIVITRTQRGEEAIGALASDGHVELSLSCTADIYESQSSNLVLGIYAKKLQKIREALNRRAPSYAYNDRPASILGSLIILPSSFLEYLRRNTLRKGWYTAYRFSHLVTRPKAYLDHLATKLRERLRNSN